MLDSFSIVCLNSCAVVRMNWLDRTIMHATSNGSIAARSRCPALRNRRIKPIWSATRFWSAAGRSLAFSLPSKRCSEKTISVRFGHMITRAYHLLKDDPALLEEERRRTRFVLVDEFQDANFAQVEILSLLAGRRRTFLPSAIRIRRFISSAARQAKPSHCLRKSFLLRAWSCSGKIGGPSCPSCGALLGS